MKFKCKYLDLIPLYFALNLFVLNNIVILNIIVQTEISLKIFKFKVDLLST